MNRYLHKIFNRLTLVGLILILQVTFFTLELIKLTNYYVTIGIVFRILSVLVTFYILYKENSPSVKIAWIIPILLVPLFGGILFLFFGHVIVPKKMKDNMQKTEMTVQNALENAEDILEEIDAINPSLKCQVDYIQKYGYGPIYKNTSATYFQIGETYFEKLLEDLSQAQKYIFMEYFIIDKGEMWDSILEILKQKVKDGVEVRVMYDDIGCVMNLPRNYALVLESYGIKCVNFNRLIPFVALILNNRDHRKITVIDGKISYTGGINLADEYINRKEVYGHWKDVGIRLEGEASWNFAVMFLQLWNTMRFSDATYDTYKTDSKCFLDKNEKGYVQPFCDTPLDNESVGENVYLNMIHASTKYVYIYTPYLICDYVLMEALCLAAKRGVDVRIVTPGIPDKKTAYYLTQSSYHMLYQAGVKIYQYTPGFMHGKCVLCDDEYAVVGSINFDYRSLYHHFECGVFLYQTDCLKDIKEDMIQVFEVSELITEEFIRNHKFSAHILGPILRLFAPLM